MTTLWPVYLLWHDYYFIIPIISIAMVDGNIIHICICRPTVGEPTNVMLLL